MKSPSVDYYSEANGFSAGSPLQERFLGKGSMGEMLWIGGGMGAFKKFHVMLGDVVPHPKTTFF